jgi:surface protein
MKTLFFKIILAYVLFFINHLIVFTQPTDCVSNSGETSTIVFGPNVNPTLNGNPLPVGTYIVAVYNSPTGLKCAGYSQWSNAAFGLSPFGATTGFAGYAVGEIYKYRLELPGGIIIPNNQINVTYKSPDGGVCSDGGSYKTNGVSCIESFQAINAESFLTVSPANLNVSASDGSSTASVTSNINWTASSNASWLTLTPTSGTNNGTLTANYQANSTNQSRSATITVSGSGVSSQTVNVTQASTAPSQPFTTVWNIPSGTSTLSFYIQTVGTTSYSWTAGSQSGSGTWGTTNGQVTINVSATANNTHLSLSISPDNLRRFYLYDFINENPSREKLINVTNWGTVKWNSMELMFNGCENLNINGSPIPPNLDNVTNMSGMFSDCQKLNGPSNIGNWNTSNVTDMSFMFDSSLAFNQPIGNWNVSKVTDMTAMFQLATSFNQPIGNWNVSNVTDMAGMFFSAYIFNQPIDNWNVSNVTDMSSMFSGINIFNQPIGNWNVSKVTDMSSMFSGNESYNQPIGSWNVANVTDMSWMFRGTSNFNHPLNDWNVSKVTDMSMMFDGAHKFNRPLNNWNVSKVTDMSQIFFYATGFNHQVGNWKLNSNVVLANLFEGSGMNCENYSATLIGWQQNNPNVKGRAMLATGLKYGTNAVAARNALINTQNWQISGDLPSGTLCSSSSTDVKNEEKGLNIYPNPTSGIILFNSDGQDLKNLEIRSLDGKLMLFVPELKDNSLDASHLMPGIYQLKGYAAHIPFVKKVVIVR